MSNFSSPFTTFLYVFLEISDRPLEVVLVTHEDGGMLSVRKRLSRHDRRDPSVGL